jgi:uncharacterized protein
MLAWLAERLAALTATRARAAAVVALFVFVGAMASVVARQIHIDTNLEALLAENAPSVRDLEELRSRQGGTDTLNIAVKSSDPEANRRLVQDIHARVRTWPEVLEASIDRDYTPLRDHALYYLEVSELEDLRDRLKREKQRAIAGKLGIGEEFDPRAVVDDDDWAEDLDDLDDLDDADPEEDGEAVEDDTRAPDDAAPRDARSVPELLQDQRDRLARSEGVRETDVDVIWPRENERGELVWEDEVGRAIASEAGDVMLVQVRLTKPATDLQFSTEIANRVEALFEELDLHSYAPDMLAKIGGAYASSGEAKSIIRDLKRATWLSATLVALVLLGGFRSPRGFVITLVPLAVSIVTTVAVARMILGELNVLTAFLFAVLLGIGVDFAVHLYTQREFQGAAADWRAVFSRHLRPLAASMLTTTGAFTVLLLADFRGFVHFGLMAAIGVVIAFVVAVVMVPALDALFGMLRSSRKGSRSPALEETGAHQWPRVRLALLAVVAGVGVLGAPRVGFERDMRELRSPKSEAEEEIGYKRALETTEHTGTPIVMMADSTEQLAQAIDRLEAVRGIELIPGTEKPWASEILSLQTHLPDRQNEKAPLLREIHEITEGFLAELPDLPDDAPAKAYETHLEVLERLSRSDPLQPEALPDWAKQLFLEKDGSIGKIALLYTEVGSYALDEIVFVTRRFREVVDPTGVRGASTRFILGDLTIAVEEDTRRLPPLALLVILGLIALDLRRLRGTVTTFFTLCLGLLLTFGVMGLWPIRINFYNLVVMPAVVGLGIDASIHLWHALKSRARPATAKAALVSALTTSGGFAGLLIATHGGLKSIGLLGVVATLSCVLIAIVALGWPRRASGLQKNAES